MFSVKACSMLACAGVAVASLAAASAADADMKSVQATLDTVVSAWDRSDAKAIAAVYADDGDLIVPDGVVVDGKRAIEAFYASAFTRGYGGTTAGARLVRGRRAGASAYVADGEWSIDGIRHPGAADTREAGIFTALFVREKGRWRLRALREQSGATTIQEAR